MTFQEKFKGMRAQLGLSQKKMSEKLKITQGAISHWERGVSRPCAHLAKKIAILVSKKNGSIDVTYLFNFESEVKKGKK